MENKKKKAFRFSAKQALIFGLAAAGVLLLLIGGRLGGKQTKAASSGMTDVSFYTDYLEERIRTLCRSIGGIEEAEVFLTLDCSEEKQYAGGASSDYLILKDGEEAVLLGEIYPVVRGVAVVCTGGDSPTVRETVTELLSAALGLPSNRIRVAGS